MTEYSYPLSQTVEENSSVLFLNGSRCCRKGLILHNDGSGVFRIKAASNTCKSIYRVHFSANIAANGALEPLSVGISQNGETLRNAIATVTPAAIGDFWNVSLETFIELPCGCCDTISIKNISETAIDVLNSNIIFERTA